LAPALEHAGAIVSPFPLTLTCEHLPISRLAEPFERLRDRSDALLAKSGRRPCVFLANLGSATSFESRRSFAKSLFEGGGIETIENEAPSTMIGIANSFRASGARIACLCSSDEVYAQQGLDAVHAFKEGGAIRLGVVGKPGHLAQKLVGANVDFLVFPGCDELGILNMLYEDVFEAKG
jgi:methylmalonyl-CoA mutase